MTVAAKTGAFDVFTIGPTHDAITARNGLSVVPKYALVDAPAIDLLLIPGGYGTRPLMHDQPLLDWIGQRATSAELVLSVCTGALLLAKAGLLAGLSATTHHAALDLLCEVAPGTNVRRDVRLVDNGRVITSAGVAAGIDMSFHVVAACWARTLRGQPPSTSSIRGSRCERVNPCNGASESKSVSRPLSPRSMTGG